VAAHTAGASNTAAVSTVVVSSTAVAASTVAASSTGAVSDRISSGRNQPGMSSSDSTQGSGSMQGQNGHKAGKSQARQVQEALKEQGHDPVLSTA